MRTINTWTVIYGVRLSQQSCRVYYTEYHAEQFKRALDLNGTPSTIVCTVQRVD